MHETISRVRAGLANARAQGKHIGRIKTRPSELIRALLKKRMKYREIASICNCSHGSINAERKEMLKEEAEAKEKALELESKSSSFPEQEETGKLEHSQTYAIASSEVVSAEEEKASEDEIPSFSLY